MYTLYVKISKGHLPKSQIQLPSKCFFKLYSLTKDIMFTSSISIEKSILISTISYCNSFCAFDFDNGIILYMAHTLPIFGCMLTWFFNEFFSIGIECENTLISLKSTTSTNLNSLTLGETLEKSMHVTPYFGWCTNSSQWQ